MPRRNPTLAVSDLAAYAADPDDFTRNGNKVRNRKAVKLGDRAHKRATGLSPRTQLILSLVAAAAAIAAVLSTLAGG
ncbi:MAG: hypothetical protein RJQ08_10650 [Salinisphaeraceae bacterium]